MEDEIEDLIGEVDYTESQKSVNVYSNDFEDVSEKHDSSGKETYTIDVDNSFECELMELETKNQENFDAMKTMENKNPKVKKKNKFLSKIVAEESFTQTSKTLIEIAQADGSFIRQTCELETQTSLICLTENQLRKPTQQYKNPLESIEMVTKQYIDDLQVSPADSSNESFNLDNFSISNETDHTKPSSKSCFDENEIGETKLSPKSLSKEDSAEDSDSSFSSKKGKKNTRDKKNINKNNSNHHASSLQPNDGDDLYNETRQMEEANIISVFNEQCYNQTDKRKMVCLLSPLSEESERKSSTTEKMSLPGPDGVMSSDNPTLFTIDFGMNVKMLPDTHPNKTPFKLPILQKNLSFPLRSRLNTVTTLSQNQRMTKTDTLPCLSNREKEKSKLDLLLKLDEAQLASGENATVAFKNGDSLKLPPIHVDSNKKTLESTILKQTNIERHKIQNAPNISINKRIEELKVISQKVKVTWGNCEPGSPLTGRSACDSEYTDDIAERGCEVLCMEILKRLRSNIWSEVAETIEDIPNAFKKFWNVMSEQRVAELLRQICGHLYSPRTQVCCSACASLAHIISKTKYTKKPDFYEVISILLVKAGSLNKPLRRAANVALDEIVSNVEQCQCIVVICCQGIDHKSNLVRSSAARLLVVCAALSAGGRGVLRSRPAAVAGARRDLLRALAVLLEDKDVDTRRYAERLYVMLRPLPNFEAYFLTDLNVEKATYVMKKFDNLIENKPSAKDTR